MIDLLHTAEKVQKWLEKNKWDFCFIGGFAVQQWGEPRLTRDLDLVIFSKNFKEEYIIVKLLTFFTPRIPKAKDFALKNRVVLVKTSDDLCLDISLGAIPFEKKMIQRSKKIEMISGIFLRICSPEDLLVLKAFASRDIDWFDIRGIILRQGAKRLDWKYVFQQLTPLADLKEDLEIVQRLRNLKNKLT